MRDWLMSFDRGRQTADSAALRLLDQHLCRRVTHTIAEGAWLTPIVVAMNIERAALVAQGSPEPPASLLRVRGLQH